MGAPHAEEHRHGARVRLICARIRQVVALLVALGRLGPDRPEITEVDCNPVIARPHGCLAVDALVVLEVPGQEPDASGRGA